MNHASRSFYNLTIPNSFISYNKMYNAYYIMYILLNSDTPIYELNITQRYNVYYNMTSDI